MDFFYIDCCIIPFKLLNAMLNKKATETTNDILRALRLSHITHVYQSVNPIVLESLESVYLQGRKDQVDKVQFEQLPDGSLKFQSK